MEGRSDSFCGNLGLFLGFDGLKASHMRAAPDGNTPVLAVDTAKLIPMDVDAKWHRSGDYNNGNVSGGSQGKASKICNNLIFVVAMVVGNKTSRLKKSSSVTRGPLLTFPREDFPKVVILLNFTSSLIIYIYF